MRICLQVLILSERIYSAKIVLTPLHVYEMHVQKFIFLYAHILRPYTRTSVTRYALTIPFFSRTSGKDEKPTNIP